MVIFYFYFYLGMSKQDGVLENPSLGGRIPHLFTGYVNNFLCDLE